MYVLLNLLLSSQKIDFDREKIQCINDFKNEYFLLIQLGHLDDNKYLIEIIY